MPRLFKKSQRYNVARNCFLAKVILLDNTIIEFNLLPEVTGSDCLEKVAQVMDIQEISYFGLQYQSKMEYLRWIDKDKPLRKQLEKNGVNGARDAELRFRIQYYVTNVMKLGYEITRYLYFLQLKHLILNGELQCSNDLAVKLASYALQAEFGDYDPEKHDDEFLNDYIFLPPHIGSPSVLKSLTDRASKFHMRHMGMSPAAAELMYIKLAQQLPEYGHEVFQTLDIHGSTIWIGACFIGIFIKHSNGQPNIYFKWPDIFRMKVKDKNFGIETPGETVYFKMPDNTTAQYVLQQMVTQHKFYRMEMEGSVGITWVTSGKQGSKKKSRSIHDLRSNKTEYNGDRTSTLLGKSSKSMNEGPMQRPLHKYNYREDDIEQTTLPHIDGPNSTSPVKIISISGRRKNRVQNTSTSPEPVGTIEVSPTHHTPLSQVSTSPHHPSSSSSTSSSPPPPPPPPISTTTTTTIATTASIANSNSSTAEETKSTLTGQTETPEHKQPQAKKLFGVILPGSRGGTPSSNKRGLTLDELQKEQEKRNRLSNHTSTSTSSTPKNSPKLKKHKIKLNGHCRNGHSNLSGDIGDNTDSSQETFDLVGPKRKKLTGSLDHLVDNGRTPPRPLKVRTFSIAEQEEQGAASGTRDRRGGQLEKKLNTGQYFNEFEQLPKKKLESNTSAGELPENIHKNRYRDILPYEESRVKLNPFNNTGRNDYINASFISFTVRNQQRNFVIAQGPMDHTCTDFWQMVWEQEIQFILMVTSEVEDNVVRYFPPDNREGSKPDYVQFEQYRVSRLFVERGNTVISRGFQLKHIPSGEERKITHLQYIDWPDNGIPENPQPFLGFLAEVRSLRQRYDSPQPILVHCSTGVGRSGVVVLMDMLIAKVDCGEAVDIYKCLKDLREQRMHMVQVADQYKFVYSAIIKYIERARLI